MKQIHVSAKRDHLATLTVIAKPWSQIIEDCRARLNFYQEKLRYAADLDSAKEYLQKAHAKYLPEVFNKAEKKK
jgi:hypothetical protein